MIYIHAIIEINNNDNQGYLRGLTPFLDKIRSMKGCIGFEVGCPVNESLDYIDIKFIKDRYVHIIQKWESMEYYNNYLLSEIKSDLRASVHSLIIEFRQYILEVDVKE
jgi:quinol monooxygenase YgiN